MLCPDTTLHRKFDCKNKNPNKKHVRLKLCEQIRNARLKLEPSVLIKNLISVPTEHLLL